MKHRWKVESELKQALAPPTDHECHTDSWLHHHLLVLLRCVLSFWQSQFMIFFGNYRLCQHHSRFTQSKLYYVVTGHYRIRCSFISLLYAYISSVYTVSYPLLPGSYPNEITNISECRIGTAWRRDLLLRSIIQCAGSYIICSDFPWDNYPRISLDQLLQSYQKKYNLRCYLIAVQHDAVCCAIGGVCGVPTERHAHIRQHLSVLRHTVRRLWGASGCGRGWRWPLLVQGTTYRWVQLNCVSCLKLYLVYLNTCHNNASLMVSIVTVIHSYRTQTALGNLIFMWIDLDRSF